MTETELFRAIHQYAADVEFHALDGHNDDPDARAKVLASIRKFADVDGHALAERNAALSGAVADLEAQLAVYDKLAYGLKLLQAKAAVCDAYLAIAEGTARSIDELREMNGKLVVAREVLRELQPKEPSR